MDQAFFKKPPPSPALKNGTLQEAPQSSPMGLPPRPLEQGHEKQRQATLKAYQALGYSQAPHAKPQLRGKAIEALQAARQAPGLASLIEQAQKTQGQLKALRGLVPAPILAQIQAGPLQEGTWVLNVKSPSAANKLRQMVPALCAHLRTKGLAIENILIKVVLGT